ncbi:MAG: protein-export membrane protein SecD [Candidatus Eisenbacteria bacterium RBG_16_71_46]|nr:MAG: protein-export membrane protein SecD [Candidatus Eisenbacteria bacterium RBG_16_71_46]OGF24201.1 MAG: protein-export membrane protein SecD [Candidatus Eisenbacteria bacterium RBG_19FT_COMBO_70_11]
MTRIDQWKLAGVVLATFLAAWYLYPSYRFYTLSPAARAALPPLELSDLRKKAIHLGLDLQGGMYLVLEVDRSGLKPAEAADATERAMEIIRNRVDQFGVAEPLIQREGEDRIAIQLPGLTNRQAAIDLIGKTALLEFKLVRTPEEAVTIFERIDSFLASRGAGRDAGLDTLLARHPLTGHFVQTGRAFAVRNEDLPAVERLLATPGLDSIIPSDSQLLWGERNQNLGGMTGREVYVLKRVPEMTGGSVANAEARVGLKDTNPGAWGVSLTLSPKGRAEFARVTGNNVGRQLSIVLDGVVSSAPEIINPIPNGQASITGNFTVDDAKELAIVLRAGALPAPVSIIEERSVGPSLGADSIQQGLTAGLAGSVLVIAFMAVYYQLSGLIAISALALNVLYVAAALAGFGATLTLPGIAGLALTIGMAVDANVLIFERIREELRNQRSVRQSVELGYNRAFRTILDANLTTLISALFLFQFGTGPIKGFAVTLSIGLIANMFTAVLFSRMVFDFMLGRGRVERLSI